MTAQSPGAPATTCTTSKRTLKSVQRIPLADASGARRGRSERQSKSGGRRNKHMTHTHTHTQNSTRALAAPATTCTMCKQTLESVQRIPLADASGARRGRTSREKRGFSPRGTENAAQNEVSKSDSRRARAPPATSISMDQHTQRQAHAAHAPYLRLIRVVCGAGKASREERGLRNACFVGFNWHECVENVMDSLGLGTPDLFTFWNV
jgi:hypothetical protein